MSWQIYVPIINAFLIVLVGFVAFVVRRSIFGEIDRLRKEKDFMVQDFGRKIDELCDSHKEELREFQEEVASKVRVLREVSSCDILRTGCQGLLLEKFINLQKVTESLVDGQGTIFEKMDELLSKVHAIEINQAAAKRP